MAYLDSDYSQIVYPVAVDAPDPKEGKKIIFLRGILITVLCAAVFFMVHYFWLDIFCAAGAVCGTMLLFGSRHCREAVTAYFILTVIPISLLAAVLIVRAAVHIIPKIVNTPELPLVLLFVIPIALILLILTAVLIIMWVKFNLAVYMEIFEDRNVLAYIKGEDDGDQF